MDAIGKRVKLRECDAMLKCAVVFEDLLRFGGLG
jgi:hypothetical protein